ncbi:MAG: gliding motility-associated C-terminal domain-containing protein [Bacteroidia bacterium]
MMILRIACALGLLCILGMQELHSQYNNNWVLSEGVQLDFSTKPPPIKRFPNNNYELVEAGVSISSNQGKLLFFANHGYIFDARGKMIDSLSNTLGMSADQFGASTTQGVTAITKPGSLYDYFVIHLDWNDCAKTGAGPCLMYTHLRHHPNPDTIELVSDQIAFHDNEGVEYTEKCMAVKKANGIDWWLIFHERKNNTFVFFSVTASGIVFHHKQAIGTDHKLGYGHYGEMVFSEQGDKLACVSGFGMIDVFDFDRCEGRLSNHIDLGTYRPPLRGLNHDFYGCSFSPSGRFLYVSEAQYRPSELFQFDLEDPSFDKVLIGINPIGTSFEQHQLGPDGKIYISNARNQTLFEGVISVIDSPENKGVACSFKEKGVQFNPFFSAVSQSGIHLPNLPNFNLGPIPFPVAEAGDTVFLNCQSRNMRIGGTEEPGLQYRWSPDRGLSNAGVAQPELDVSTIEVGEFQQYILTVTDPSRSCRNTNQDTIIVTRLPERGPPAADAGPDTSICEGAGLFLGKTVVPGYGYRWEGLGLSANDVAQPWVRPFVPGMYVLTVSDLGGPCRPMGRDTVVVDFGLAAQRADAGPDIALCTNLPFEDVIGTEQTAGYVYRWSPADGLSDPRIAQPSINAAGHYFLEVEEDSFCLSYDSVEVLPAGSFADAGSDIALCDNQPFSDLLGSAEIPGLRYRWQPETGLSDASLARPEVSLPGRYLLTVSRDSICTSQDSVVVSLTTCTDIILPNAISPNGDGINETFYITNLPPGSSLTIWHRWGKIAWQSATYQQDFRAEGLPEGVYAVVLTLPDGEVVTGTVMVIR